MASTGSMVHQFALQLYKVIGTGDKNVFFSPHSVSAALMLVCLGAKEETYKQIVKAVGIDTEGDVHETFKKLNDQIAAAKGDGIETNLANRIYTRNDVKVLEAFVKSVSEYYDGSIEALDFTTNPDASRITINKWVEEQTNNKIKDLLAPGLITSITQMVVANAIYFKGLWEKPFMPQTTKEADFNVTLDEKVKVQMMKASLKLPHVTDDDLAMSAVAVPYKGNTMSMVILRPNKIDGLAKMEGALTTDRLQEIFDTLLAGRKYGVDLSLPRFKMTVTSDLKPVLQAIGIHDLFDGSKVNLTGMFESNGAPVTDVVHKAFIEVNEEGTEAAAATAMMSRMMLLPVPNEDFRCDRPFMFCLVENTSRCILFMGKLFKPE